MHALRPAARALVATGDVATFAAAANTAAPEAAEELTRRAARRLASATPEAAEGVARSSRRIRVPPVGGAPPASSVAGAPRGVQNVLVVGAERPDEFAYAAEVAGRGHNVVVINPRVTNEARQFAARGGNFVAGEIETLPRTPTFDLIREDFPNPQPFFPATRAMASERLSRLAPGGRWIVVTEAPEEEFVSSLRAVAVQERAALTVRQFPAFHEGAPWSGYASYTTRRFVLIFEKAR
jgi:hypothetical protein